MAIVSDSLLPLSETHAIAELVHHRLLHGELRLTEALILSSAPVRVMKDQAPAAGRVPGQDQVHVSEFVPEIATGEGRFVRVTHQLPSGNRLEHHEVRRRGLVPSGDHSVDDPNPSLRRDDQVGPPVVGVSVAVLSDRGLEAANHGGANSDDSTAGLDGRR